MRRRIDEGTSEKDVRIRVAELEADAAKQRAIAANAYAYAKEQTRRAWTERVHYRELIEAARNRTKIALAKIARGQAVEAASHSSAEASPPPASAEREEPAAE
jgi:hypothetical protein